MKMLERKTVEVVKDSELGPEIIAKLVSLQGEIFSRLTEVVELPSETLIDIPVEPTWS